jgi:predicted AlkP superfamily phosphohydrolase/phosphomutase
MTKVILIGIDGATLNLIENWMDNNELPNLNKIRNKGIHGNLRSTTPYYSAPAWVSIVTGCNPGKHGIYDFFCTDSYSKRIINSRYRKTNAIWNILSDNDKKTIAVNIPGTYPPEKIKGIMITGLLTPSPNSDFTYPKSIKEDLIKEKLGEYELEQVAVDDIPKNLTARYAPEKFASQINDITTSHGNVTMNLMKKYDWDFTMLVFRGTDDIQHLLWNNKPLILSCYKKADYYIGKMMEEYPEAIFIIVSDHGFGKPEKYFYVNNALYNNGFIKTTSDPRYNLNTIFISIFDKLSKFIFHVIPLKTIVRSNIGRKLILSTGSSSNIDFKKTKAYYHSVCSRGIRINLKKKYEHGFVEKKDYEVIRNEIINFLNQIKDPETDEKIVKNIYKWEEIYGEKAENDPLDIIFDLKENYGAQELLQPPEGLKNIFKSKNQKLSYISKPGFYDWMGDHLPNGILFMYGENIKSNIKINASILDIVPTILALMKIPIPDNLDGKVIEEAFIKKPKIDRIENKKSYLTKSEINKIIKLKNQNKTKK